METAELTSLTGAVDAINAFADEIVAHLAVSDGADDRAPGAILTIPAGHGAS